MNGHIDDTGLSEILDAEAADDAGTRSHLSTCRHCQVRLGELRAVAAAVKGGTPPPPGARREEHLATALAAMGEGTQDPEAAGSVPSTARRAVAVRALGLAAALVLMGGGVVAIAASRRSHTNAAAAISPANARPPSNGFGPQVAAGSGAGSGGPSAVAGTAGAGAGGGPTGPANQFRPVDGGQLGTQNDIGRLSDLVSASVSAHPDGNTDATSPGYPPTAPPCDAEARRAAQQVNDTFRPGPGAIYFARLTFRGSTAIVLAYPTASKGQTPGLQLEVMRLTDCAVLADRSL